MEKAKPKRWRRIVRIVAIVVVCAVVVVLAMIGYTYWHNDRVYDNVSEVAFGGDVNDVLMQNVAVASEDEGENEGVEEEAGEEAYADETEGGGDGEDKGGGKDDEVSDGDGGSDADDGAAPAESYLDLASIHLDWDALAAINPDVVGWVYMPDTVINYPVVQGEDNEYYLNYNFGGERAYNWTPMVGTPFLYAENAPDFSDPVNFIQAHNMANGKMFAAIPKLMNKGFDTHRTAYVFTPTANYRLMSISMVICAPTDYSIVRTKFNSHEEFVNYVRSAVNHSVVKVDPAGPAPEDIDKLIVLSTCTSDRTNRRCLLVCAVADSVSFMPTQEEAAVESAQDVVVDYG